MHEEKFNPPPMRGIKQAVAEIKAADPNTALTERALRRLVLTGTIPHVSIGRKFLVNMNALYGYLSNGTVPGVEAPAAAPISGVRRVAE